MRHTHIHIHIPTVPISVALGLLTVLSLLVAACSPTTAGPMATATAAPTCATALPGAGAISLGADFVYPFTSPAGTVGTTPATTISGADLFTVHEFDACTPSATPASVTAFYDAQLPALPHGWSAATTFPFDGGLMRPCSAPCFFDPRGGPLYYLVVDQLTALGSVVRYHVRWAVFSDAEFPTCNANFTSGPPAQQLVYFVPGFTPAIPIPPASSVTQSAAAGGQRLIEVCSSGSAAVVTQFMQKYLAVTGWTMATTSGWCSYACWVNGAAVISWPPISDPTDWDIAWR
jgi:hypothetical protein